MSTTAPAEPREREHSAKVRAALKRAGLSERAELTATQVKRAESASSRMSGARLREHIQGRRNGGGVGKGAHADWDLPKRPEPSGKPEPEDYGPVKDWVLRFANERGTTDHDAPVKELPFVQGGRLYFKALPLIVFLVRDQKIEPRQGPLAKALRDAGFERAPFAFKKKGRQTGASHYSIAAGKLQGLQLGERQKPAKS